MAEQNEKTRKALFAFVGAPRPELESSIRGKLIEQCQASSACKLLDCNSGGNNCAQPGTIMRVFQRSIYCLQPTGDFYTRRSAFDSFQGGCIPVSFHPGSAYNQYLWHLPKNHTKYSMFIPVKNVTDLNEVSIEKTLLGISKTKELAMREELIRLIPNLVYSDPMSRLETPDAFDIAVKRILERIENVRKMSKEGKDPSFGFTDEEGDKFKFNVTKEN